MCSTPPPDDRRWDASPVHVPARRSLRVAPDAVSRLLRCGQSDRCRDCGNRIEWYQRGRHSAVRLHPGEVLVSAVPAACCWHVSSGVAHPSQDGTPWCRLPHAVLCPARPAPQAAPELAELRRMLAVNTRRMIDAGAFTPPLAEPACTPAPAASGCRPARPTVQILYVRYLAAHPVDEIQCVAQTRRRHRCTTPVLAPGSRGGQWSLMPVTAHAGQLDLPAETMAVYSLAALQYAEQLRWRSQRCPQHAATPTAADLALAEWERFDPFLHSDHIHTRLPTLTRKGGTADHPRRGVQA
ncbi:DUF6083 domain-containing protein [Streptomyces sp. PAM3C]|uniref:DUF6083 domain-containing protein n=1 Tax=Streptomyces sp. PAM3C TaxID=2847300 RepID=UPI001C1E5399|nr:DUF6083 domain-containing protein [Streptomyces sp. PAM3C]MBU5947658.1 hypothetical protein [Streptomyces sp. PAM3C]